MAIVRNFTKVDLQKTGELYKAVTSKTNKIFWWVGGEDNWSNVFIAIEEGQVIGKGQVGIVSAIPQGDPLKHKHYIYLNLKTLPEREEDYPIYELLFEPMLTRAYELKKTLPEEYTTMVAIGNQTTEEHNNNYFIGKEFEYKNSLFTMRRDLSHPIQSTVINPLYQCNNGDMSSEESINDYLIADMEIWPHAPIGIKRLKRNQEHTAWTTFIVRDSNVLIGSVMTWIDKDGDGIIEDVFVREPWRKQGIAKHLLSQSLIYLQNNGCTFAELQVETANGSALALYRRVGFREVSEEVRYHKEL